MRTVIAPICIVVAIWMTSVEAADWPQFLGSHRTGIAQDTGLIDRIDEKSPVELWRQPVIGGMSGIAIAEGRLMTLAQSDGKQWLVALDRGTGKQLWKAAVADEFQNAMGHGPRATPTIHGPNVFVYTGEGILVAVQASDGKILWSKNMPKELKCKPSDYGMSCSPLVQDSLVIVHVGGTEGAVVALDQKSGSIVWKAGEGAAGYSSPVLMKLGNTEQVVSFLGSHVVGIAPKTGQLLWSYPFETDYACNTACPIAVGDNVLISAGENQGSVMLGLESNPNGWKVSELWKSVGTSSVLRSEWQTPVLIDGSIFGFDNSGSAGPVTHLSCLDASTGKLHWKQLRFGKGNLIAADGKLIMTSIKGEIAMVRASKKGFEELGRKTVIGFTRQAPVLSNGLLYLRDEAEILCLDFRTGTKPD